MSEPPDMGPPSVEKVLIGALLVLLDQELPGLADRLQLLLDDPFSNEKVVLLRPQSEWAEQRLCQEQAAIWAARAAILIAGQRWSVDKRQKRRK
jgi:hypothetical protein